MPLGRLWILGLVTVGAALWLPARAATPGNGWVVWGSNRTDGRHEVYLMKADGTGVTRLTHAGGKAPSWSRDGNWIAYNHTPDDSVHLIRPDGTGDKQICATNIKQSNGGYLPPFWLHDKSGVLCRSGGDYHVVHPDTGATKPLFKHSDFTQLAGADFMPSSLTHDNRYVLTATDRYRNGYQGTNGSFKAFWAAVIVDRTDKSKLYFLGPGCEPTTPPVGDAVFHVCGAKGFCPYGYDIARMSIKDLLTRSSYATEMARSDANWGHEYFPRISNDNKWLVYGASQGCHDHDTCDYEIFIHALGSGNAGRTRLTSHAKNDRWPDLHVGSLWQPGTPNLSLAPTSLIFSAEQGAADPLQQVVTVSNAGTGTLASVSAEVVHGTGSGWLTVTPSESGNSQSLANDVSVVGLSPGTHAATVEVTAPGAGNSPRSYTVSLTVTAPGGGAGFGDGSVTSPPDSGPTGPGDSGGAGPGSAGQATPGRLLQGGCSLAGAPRACPPWWILSVVLLLRRRRCLSARGQGPACRHQRSRAAPATAR